MDNIDTYGSTYLLRVSFYSSNLAKKYFQARKLTITVLCKINDFFLTEIGKLTVALRIPITWGKMNDKYPKQLKFLIFTHINLL